MSSPGKHCPRIDVCDSGLAAMSFPEIQGSTSILSVLPPHALDSDVEPKDLCPSIGLDCARDRPLMNETLSGEMKETMSGDSSSFLDPPSSNTLFSGPPKRFSRRSNTTSCTPKQSGEEELLEFAWMQVTRYMDTNEGFQFETEDHEESSCGRHDDLHQ